ncbi:hypothetical protein CFter6_3397 [Collimonas fungivorans]|uniref:Uncharacterized protein n=1 Tax=Collimonas fungivorans TaxID=158899 RepID=A0A127PDY7_9BURK|nr:hypothetical protein CFter6_3397 [Collimonas fungivorans]
MAKFYQFVNFPSGRRITGIRCQKYSSNKSGAYLGFLFGTKAAIERTMLLLPIGGIESH